MDIKDLGFLDIKEASFFLTEGGFAGLKYKGEDHKHIILRRTMPIKEPMKYISIADHENKEIAIIASVDELPDQDKNIVIKELDNRYYSPEIVDIISVQDKLGYLYISMRLRNKQGNEYDKSCAIKDVTRNIRMIGDNSVIIFDVDGNRYVSSDLKNMNKASLRRLDSYLF